MRDPGLAPSTINVRLSAIRKLAAQAPEAGLLSTDLTSAIRDLKGARKLGVRAGHWLTKEQASRLLHAPGCATLKGKRDRALLALLIGCGLRRSELAYLEFERIQQREGRWVSIQTTEQYLGTPQNLTEAVNDRLVLEV